MPSFAALAALAAAFSAVPLVSAHGYVSGIVVDGKYYEGTNPNWLYGKKATPGWYAMNQDNGFVSPDAYSTTDIACHKQATPGGSSVPVAAGQKVELQWNTWPDSHHGPVINYMAAVDGDFSSATAGGLNFFKVAEGGLVDDSNPPGTWATDQLIANNFSSTFTIPSSLKAGNYVVRHEIIALHSAGSENGAQNYPQCVNFQVTGGGSATPCSSGAACAKGTGLYKSTDPGILISIYSAISSYTIPGPKLWSGASSKKRTAAYFEA